MQTTAQIITVGDELLLGQVVDTNSAWIGEKAADNGLPIAEILSVADKHDAIVDALARGFANHSVIIITGGLGPTKDDITKRAVADFFGVDLVRDKVTFTHVRSLMEARGVDFNELNKAQADIPAGFTALLNEVGTAPGLYGEKDGKIIFCLPGVPFEMKQLFEKQVIPAIHKYFALKSVVRRSVLLFGIAESELAVKIEDWENSLPPYMSLAYLPNPKGIRLRVSVYEIPAGVDAIYEISTQFKALRDIIPEFYLGYEPTSIEKELSRRLLDKGYTMAAAESCTGGSISARCTALAGASAWYKGSVTAYDNRVKIDVLGVEAKLIEQHGAVSAQVVQAMAIGVRRLLGTDFAVATSGIAGPDGGSEQKPAGTVWIAVAHKSGVSSFCRNYGSPREVCIERASSAALAALLHSLD